MTPHSRRSSAPRGDGQEPSVRHSTEMMCSLTKGLSISDPRIGTRRGTKLCRNMVELLLNLVHARVAIASR